MTPRDFGWWLTPSGQRQLLTWHPTSGILTLGPHPIGKVLDELDLHRRLSGWADHCEQRDGLMWLAGRLEGCR